MPLASPTLGDPVDVGDLVARIQRDLRGNLKEPFDLLSSALTAVTTDENAIVATGIDQIVANAFVAIDEEILLVKTVAGTTITFQRGLYNTNITSHAIGSLVEVNPRYFPSTIGDAIVEEIRSWPQDIYRVRTDTIAFGASDQMIDWDPAPNGFRRILDARFNETSGDHPVDMRVEVVPNLDTADYPSGYGIRRADRIVAGNMRLAYASDFTLSSVSLSTTLATIGLPASLYDALIFGVLWRLLTPREIQVLDRTAQPQPRSATDTPPTRTVAVAGSYKQLRDERLANEATRLRDLYPPRF